MYIWDVPVNNAAHRDNFNSFMFDETAAVLRANRTVKNNTWAPGGCAKPFSSELILTNIDPGDPASAGERGMHSPSLRS